MSAFGSSFARSLSESYTLAIIVDELLNVMRDRDNLTKRVERLESMVFSEEEADEEQAKRHRERTD